MPAGGLFQPYAVEVSLSNPYTFRATALANVTGLLAAIALFALGLSVVVAAFMARRFTTPLRRLTEASRGLAEGDLSRRVPAEPGPRRVIRTGRARRPVQRDGGSARGERPDHPARSRSESRLPGRRLARTADAAGRPAHVQRTAARRRRPGPGDPGRVHRVERSADRAARLAGPEPARTVETRFWPGACSTFGRTTSAPRSNLRWIRAHRPPASAASVRGPASAGRPRSGSVTTRSGSARSWPTSWPTPSSSPSGAVGRGGPERHGGRRANRCRRHRRRDRSPPNCHRSSSGSIAARSPTRRAAAGAVLDWPSPGRSWKCMAARSPSESRVGAGSKFTVELPRDPRLVEGSPAAVRADVASAATEPRSRNPEPDNVAETSPSDGSQVNTQAAR